MYEEQTPEAIKARMLEDITTLDTREGSFADSVVGPIAVELSRMYAALDAVRYMVWVDETSGPYLDLAAEDLGMEPRKEGTRAQVTLALAGKPGYIIPGGSSFFTEDGLYFVLEEQQAIPESGALLAPATAREEGEAYNVPANAIVHPARCDARLDSVTNPDPAAGGADPESDLSLYRRIAAYRQRPATSGNEAHYEQWALEVPGVGMAKAQGVWNGPGTVRVLIADEDSQPVDDSIRQDCAQHIEQKRPVGPAVTVMSAVSCPVRVAATVKLRAGVSLEQVTEAYRVALTAYFRAISFRRFVVRYNRVCAILMAVDGVVDYEDLTINGQRVSLNLTVEQVPVLGGVMLE